MSSGLYVGATLLLLASGCRTAPPPVPETPLPPGQVVVVQPGQTLGEIARESGVSVEELVEVNGLRSADEVSVGQTLFIPEPARPRPPRPASPRPTPPAPPALPPPPTATAPTTVLAWPLDGVVLRDFIPPGDKRGPYDGVLLAAPDGTEVRSARAGVVAFSGSQGTRLGTIVVIDHGEDLVTIYGHLGRAMVKAGQRLEAGDVVGVVGTSGLLGVSPRLYFEVRQARAPVDPLPLLPP